MIARAIRGSVVIGMSITIAAFACGGKIDDASQSQVNERPTTEPGPPPLPTVGPLPGPGPAQAPVADDIADAYCTTFSKCCQSSGQPPIDIARCREVTATTVNGLLNPNQKSPVSGGDAQRCIDAIRARTAACSTVDINWPSLVDFAGQGIFAPRSVRSVCRLLVDVAPTGGANCSPKTACSSGTCAVDECTGDVAEGAACPDRSCLDGLTCDKSGVCSRPSLGASGARCITSEDCQLGLVCAKNQCVTARSVPSLYEERHSPYRVGFDTCRIFQFL